MGNCHFKTDFDTENITGKFSFIKINAKTILWATNNHRYWICSKNNLAYNNSIQNKNNQLLKRETSFQIS